jgi:hypothetical protein
LSDPPAFAHGTLWRVFPWDPAARDGAPFSARSVAPPQIQNFGRFDQRGKPPVLYLAETRTHAVAEILRGRLHSPDRPPELRHTITNADLQGPGHRRALVSVRIPTQIAERVCDTNEGEVLARFGVRADRLSSNAYRTSQAAARQIHRHPDRVPGFVWSSRFGGDWHVVLLFLDRVPLAVLEIGTPEPLRLNTPAVLEAARILHADIAVDTPRT